MSEKASDIVFLQDFVLQTIKLLYKFWHKILNEFFPEIIGSMKMHKLDSYSYHVESTSFKYRLKYMF